MKFIFLFTLLIYTSAAFSADGELMESGFHLLSMKCEPENGEGADTSPQSPPLDIDDTGTPGCNRWEINVTFSGNLAQSERSWDLPLLDMNYGIGDNIQLKYEVPMERLDSVDSSATTVGDSMFGIKYMFFEDEKSNLQVAVYPQVQFATPTTELLGNNVNPAAGNITSIPILVSKKIGENRLGDILFTGNVEYSFSSRADTKDFAFVGAGLGVPIFKKVSLMGELSTTQAMANDFTGIRQQLVKANAGMIGTVNRQFLLFGSIGQSLYSSDNLSHTYVLLGMRILAGGADKLL